MMATTSRESDATPTGAAADATDRPEESTTQETASASASSIVAPSVTSKDIHTNSSSSEVSTTIISNFDVLLMADSETGILGYYTSSSQVGAGVDLNDDNDDIGDSVPKGHVGNQRFQVTLSMYRDDFEKRHNKGHDTSPIINKLISIVTEHCVPPGRFLQINAASKTTTAASAASATEACTVESKAANEAKGEQTEHHVSSSISPKEEKHQPQQESQAGKSTSWVWMEVPRASVEEFIERSLMPSPDQSISRQSVLLNHGLGPTNKRTSRRISFADMEATYASLAEEEVATDQEKPPPLRLPVSVATGNNDAIGVTEDEKKRRRRSSLLRRSLSDHLLPPAALELFNKKKMNRTTEERRPSLWRAFGHHRMVKQPEPIDIVLSFPTAKDNDSKQKEKKDNKGTEKDDEESDEESESNDSYDDSVLALETAELAPNQTKGNNRLRVLMQLQTENYDRLSADERAKMVLDWIHTVTKFWKGRFLKFDPTLETYEVMDAGQVESALATVMTSMINCQNFEDVETLTSARVDRTARAAMVSGLARGETRFLEEEEEIMNSFREASTGYSMASDSDLSSTTNSQWSSNSATIHRANLPTSFAQDLMGAGGGGARQRQVSAGANSVQSAPPLQSDLNYYQPQAQQKRRSFKDFLPKIPHLGEMTRGYSDSAVMRSHSNRGARASPPQQRRDSKLPDPPKLQPTTNSAASEASPTDIQGMRNAAVESLQRRKKRQGLASRIQVLTQTSLRRTSIAISAAAASASSVATGGRGSNKSNDTKTYPSGSFNGGFPPPPLSIVGSSFRRTSVMSSVSNESNSRSQQQQDPMAQSMSLLPPMSTMRRTSGSSLSTIGSSRMDTQAFTEEIVFDNNPPRAVFTSYPIFSPGTTGNDATTVLPPPLPRRTTTMEMALHPLSTLAQIAADGVDDHNDDASMQIPSSLHHNGQNNNDIGNNNSKIGSNNNNSNMDEYTDLTNAIRAALSSTAQTTMQDKSSAVNASASAGADASMMDSLLQAALLPSPRISLTEAEVNFEVHDDDDVHVNHS